VADDDRIKMVTYRVTINGSGQIVPAEDRHSQVHTLRLNDIGRSQRDSSIGSVEEQSPTVKDRMDISLHNFGDYPPGT
jgi:hypothetical protein